ncbi:MAG: phosphoglucosamine mutase [Rickettsiales bacterium]|jgi:phosphoglucosamine mutase|nr:phosphoglucosamine mutase [Rickettsiales bacterium]
MGKYFGTDGVRGRANTGNMTGEFALKLGAAMANILNRENNKKCTVVLGKDTRRSGYMLESALTAGLTSGGVSVYLIGPVPTPGVAMLIRSMRCDLGIMITASHNPYYDNGIKLFDSNGMKFPDRIEEEIEKEVDNPRLMENLVQNGEIGRAWRSDNYIYQQRYIEFVKSTFPRNLSLRGLKIVLDCSNGASYKVAPMVLWELGAEVIKIACDPNGVNINDDCGSTKPQNLQKKVLTEKANLGIAFDGDADRVIMADEKGRIVDGDKIMAIIAKQKFEEGKLNKNTLVATQMSNLGLELYLKKMGIAMVRAKIGDRYVAEEMRKNGYNLGGEQTGHIILGDFSTTGDGLCSALQVLAALEAGRKKNPNLVFSELSSVYDPIPQRLNNIIYGDKNPLDTKEADDFIKRIAEEIKPDGRILIRKSGTEPLIRVMVEHKDEAQLEKFMEKISDKIKSFL